MAKKKSVQNCLLSPRSTTRTKSPRWLSWKRKKLVEILRSQLLPIQWQSSFHRSDSNLQSRQSSKSMSNKRSSRYAKVASQTDGTRTAKMTTQMTLLRIPTTRVRMVYRLGPKRRMRWKRLLAKKTVMETCQLFKKSQITSNTQGLHQRIMSLVIYTIMWFNPKW